MIREARPDEAGALAAIQRDASLAALADIFPPELYPYPLDDVTRRWEESLADGGVTVLVAEENGTAAGVAGCRREWLDGLYVLPQWWGPRRGQGPARRGPRPATGAEGCGRCHLWVLEDNGRARTFYERLGWIENGTSRVVPFPPNPIDIGYSLEL